MADSFNAYVNTLSKTFLPLSVSNIIADAIKEWYFTGVILDTQKPNETCELCLNTHLRYQFEIANRLTKNRLMVGSSCILKFGVAVYGANGNILPENQAKSRLNELMNGTRQRTCIANLTALAQSESNDILQNALNYYTDKGFLSPKLAFVVLWQLKRKNIDHCPTFFKVSIRSNRLKDDLKTMETSRVHVIWPSLSSSQKQYAISCGHTAP